MASRCYTHRAVLLYSNYTHRPAGKTDIMLDPNSRSHSHPVGPHIAPLSSNREAMPADAGEAGHGLPSRDLGLRRQLAAIVGREPAGSFVELRLIPRTSGRREQVFIPVGDPDLIARRVPALAARGDLYIGVCPRVGPLMLPAIDGEAMSTNPNPDPRPASATPRNLPLARVSA